MHQFNKSIAFLVAIFFMFTQIACHKNCNVYALEGSWTFIQNGDPATQYVGTIEKHGDHTIHVQYDSSATITLNGVCKDGVLIYDEIRPLGNHGNIKIAGSSTASRIDFSFKEVNFHFTKEGAISGTKNQ